VSIAGSRANMIVAYGRLIERPLRAARRPSKPRSHARRSLAPRTVRARFIRLLSPRPKIPAGRVVVFEGKECAAQRGGQRQGAAAPEGGDTAPYRRTGAHLAARSTRRALRRGPWRARSRARRAGSSRLLLPAGAGVIPRPPALCGFCGRNAVGAVGFEPTLWGF
jgi:hypothetical protein